MKADLVLSRQAVFVRCCPECRGAFLNAVWQADISINQTCEEGILDMVFEKIKAILAEQFSEDEDSITMATDLTEDLGADSLDLADVLMAIEDEFEVEVQDEDIESIKTVGDIVEYIESRK